RRDIVLQFLSESVAITGSGSLLGLLLGVAAAFGITAAMRASLSAPIHAGLSLSTMLVAAASAVVVGLSFGTYPAIRAARLSPVPHPKNGRDKAAVSPVFRPLPNSMGEVNGNGAEASADTRPHSEPCSHPLPAVGERVGSGGRAEPWA